MLLHTARDLGAKGKRTVPSFVLPVTCNGSVRVKLCGVLDMLDEVSFRETQTGLISGPR